MADAAVAAYFAMALKWRPVSFVKSFSFKGGYQGHALPVESGEVETAGGTLAFLKLEKRCEWLCKAVGGPKANVRDTLKRSRLFEELRTKLLKRALVVIGPRLFRSRLRLSLKMTRMIL